MNIISKMGTTHFNATTKAPDPREAAGKDAAETNVGAKGHKERSGPLFPPSSNTVALGGQHSQDSFAATMLGFTESKLKRQGLEALVAVLRSLVVWGTGVGSGGVGGGVVGAGFGPNGAKLSANPDSDGHAGSSRMSVDDVRAEDCGPSSAGEASGSLNTVSSAMGRSNPDLADDPSKFETAKQRKTTLLEGIRKFNFKPKKVRKTQLLQ